MEVDSAGLNHDAEVPLSPEQLVWAELILVMETRHRERLSQRFAPHLARKRIAVLDIPDEFPFMDPDLIELIRSRCARYLP